LFHSSNHQDTNSEKLKIGRPYLNQPHQKLSAIDFPDFRSTNLITSIFLPPNKFQLVLNKPIWKKLVKMGASKHRGEHKKIFETKPPLQISCPKQKNANPPQNLCFLSSSLNGLCG